MDGWTASRQSAGPTTFTSGILLLELAIPGVTIDGSGDVFYSTTYTASSTTYSEVNEFPLAGVAGASPTGTNAIASQLVVNGFAGTGPQDLAVDSSGSLWLSQIAVPTNQEIDYIYPSASSTGYSAKNIADTNTHTPRGLAIGQTSTGTETINSVGTTFESFNPPATVGGTPAINFETISGSDIGGLVSPTDPHGAAVDGASNVWSNCSTESGNYVTLVASNIFALCEVSSTGVNISPTYVTSSKSYGGFQKPTAILPSTPASIAVDFSGNVWTGAHTGTQTEIMELVGQAVPIVTPLSVAVGAGTLGAKP